MADATHPNQGSVGAMSVMTIAQYRHVKYASEPGSIVRYSCPTDAVRAAVERVAMQPTELYAIIHTAEAHNEGELAERFRFAQRILQPGQVAVTFAAQELSRMGLDDQYRFELVGNFEIGSTGAQDRLFLVAHEQLRPVRHAEAVQVLPKGGFVGRTADLGELRRRIDLFRIISVNGAPGIGKSCLIRRFADEIADEFPGRIIYADLATVGQPEVVVPFLLRLTGAMRLPGESPLEAFTAHIRDRQSLLILDNGDTVISEVRHLASHIFKTTDNVVVIIGSSRPTKIHGESRYKLEGLEVPVPEESAETIAEYDSVALFVDRAMMVDSKFRFTPNNASAIARLCQRLDGIPLAIELAAARVSILSPRQILDRLDHRFLLLQDLSSGRPIHHRTLRATVEWSYQQLRKESKVLYRRLAMFEGAFSIEDAALVAIDGNTLTLDDLYSAFDELVEASLITTSTTEGREKRFFMPETFRIHALDILKQSGDEPEVHRRYQGWVLSLDDSASTGLVSSAQLDWLHRIDAGYEDIVRLVEECCTANGDIASGMKLLLAIHTYYFHRSYFSEGIRLVNRVIGHRRAASHPLYPRIQNLAAALLLRQGDRVKAHSHAVKSYRSARANGDLISMASARSTLGTCATETGRLPQACKHLRRTLETFRSLQDPRLVNCLVNLVATETDAGQYSLASKHACEAAGLLEDQGNPVLMAYLNLNRGYLALSEGQYWIALTYTEWASDHFIESGDHYALARALRNAAFAFEALGRLRDAAFLLGAVSRLEPTAGANGADLLNRRILQLISRLKESLESEYLSTYISGSLASRADIQLILKSRSSI